MNEILNGIRAPAGVASREPATSTAESKRQTNKNLIDNVQTL